MRTSTLIKMANQIAASVPDQANADQQTAAHLAAFWTPAMIHSLAEHVQANPDDVSSAVRDALTRLQQA